MADTSALGADGRKSIRVQVSYSVPTKQWRVIMATRESRKITIREHEKETIWMLNRATELRELIGKRIKLAKPIRSGFKRSFIVDRKKCTKNEYVLLNSILPLFILREYL